MATDVVRGEKRPRSVETQLKGGSLIRREGTFQEFKEKKEGKKRGF